jgi:hypothetical protein
VRALIFPLGPRLLEGRACDSSCSRERSYSISCLISVGNSSTLLILDILSIWLI